MRERTKASVQRKGLEDVLSTCSSLSDVADKQFVLDIDYNNSDVFTVGMDVEDDGGRLGDAVIFQSLPEKNFIVNLRKAVLIDTSTYAAADYIQTATFYVASHSLA